MTSLILFIRRSLMTIDERVKDLDEATNAKHSNYKKLLEYLAETTDFKSIRSGMGVNWYEFRYSTGKYTYYYHIKSAHNYCEILSRDHSTEIMTCRFNLGFSRKFIDIFLKMMAHSLPYYKTQDYDSIFDHLILDMEDNKVEVLYSWKFKDVDLYVIENIDADPEYTRISIIEVTRSNKLIAMWFMATSGTSYVDCRCYDRSKYKDIVDLLPILCKKVG